MRDPDALPQRILPRLMWSFSGGRYASREEFSAAVEEYQLHVAGEPRWFADEVVRAAPELEVLVRVPGRTREDEVQTIVVRGAHGGPVRALDLMFALHQELAPALRDEGRRFFEGLTLERLADGRVRYWLRLGT